MECSIRSAVALAPKHSVLCRCFPWPSLSIRLSEELSLSTVPLHHWALCICRYVQAPRRLTSHAANVRNTQNYGTQIYFHIVSGPKNAQLDNLGINVMYITP